MLDGVTYRIHVRMKAQFSLRRAPVILNCFERDTHDRSDFLDAEAFSQQRHNLHHSLTKPLTVLLVDTVKNAADTRGLTVKVQEFVWVMATTGHEDRVAVSVGLLRTTNTTLLQGLDASGDQCQESTRVGGITAFGWVINFRAPAP